MPEPPLTRTVTGTEIDGFTELFVEVTERLAVLNPCGRPEGLMETETVQEPSVEAVHPVGLSVTHEADGVTVRGIAVALSLAKNERF